MYVKPTKDLKRPATIWKLKKTVYGIYDGSRAFYKAIDDDLIKMGATRNVGEEALYAFHEGEGEKFKLTGLVGLHADDFNTMRTDDFHKKIIDPLQKLYVFGKVQNHIYRFTGVDSTRRSTNLRICKSTATRMPATSTKTGKP